MQGDPAPWERTAAVFCVGSRETVPCTRLLVADHTFAGLQVVLWRTHAGVDVGGASSSETKKQKPIHASPILVKHPWRGRGTLMRV